ncbi:peptide chain release factor N(5)-glutamine methyltransferase [Pasteurella atlantica]|uniref:peptide chain release factor N(5)-glutamine methyltransferase n=1 Tax=Pasteurellaceae TaxID=712 RepID=UPI002753FB03|nr:peptide chain release factor N(5)-glutamine methyltransferase [Pasteurella atlantica]MDP8099449.1 peptide chain release factor N(5)-glutamine methyltransferase [Pasteurella atlantica]MDP8107337.1 peptide chain release factor N(5)-glutamine methyltransferase [Pasteurella atlantica]MDP8117029.1 peptide chain release factor N(5)-glutamine methyltransferase [Pasteurella atlantica]
MNYAQWLNDAEVLLSKNCKQDPYLNPKSDARVLLQFVTRQSKSRLFAFAETELLEAEQQQLKVLLSRRLKGEPIAYIIGKKEFWSLPLKVATSTLIPRPDTERLVEVALEFALKRLDFCENLQILDLGTGTGAIALALASELGKKVQIIGVDKSLNAVQLAEQNRKSLGFEQVHFLQSDWFSSLQNKQFDLIVSNPPYIDKQDQNLQRGDVRFEPLSALVAEQQGLSDLQKIVSNAPLYLASKGGLFLEHGWQQAIQVQQLFDLTLWNKPCTEQDYANNDRVTWAILK